MKKLACAVLLSLFALPVLAQSAPATRQAPASCITLEQVQSNMDPVHLTRSMLVCIAQGRNNDAVDLFNMGGAFAKFDTLRVSDVSAHSAYPALKSQAASMLSEAQAEGFNSALRTRSQSDGYNRELCRVATRLHAPSYAPTYMTNHGMGAFTGKPQMTAGFDANTAWDEVLARYLRCG